MVIKQPVMKTSVLSELVDLTKDKVLAKQAKPSRPTVLKARIN